MEEKERYYSLIDCNGNFELRDYGSNREFHSLYELDDLLNQQDKRIKELEEKVNRISEINLYNRDLAKNSIKDVIGLRQENRTLKEQLKNEEQSHDLCIKSFEEETDKLRKQIKFESDARKRFVAANKKLKQSKKQLAIEKLKELRYFIDIVPSNDYGVLFEIKNKIIEQLEELQNK